MTKNVFPLKIADAEASVHHIFVRDLVLPAAIGVYAHEHGVSQTVRVNVDLTVTEPVQPLNDALVNVVDYEKVVIGIKQIIAEGHIYLIETLAERIAAICLADYRVQVARVRVEKLDIIPDAASVGVEIERIRSPK